MNKFHFYQHCFNICKRLAYKSLIFCSNLQQTKFSMTVLPTLIPLFLGSFLKLLYALQRKEDRSHQLCSDVQGSHFVKTCLLCMLYRLNFGCLGLFGANSEYYRSGFFQLKVQKRDSQGGKKNQCSSQTLNESHISILKF